MSEGGLGYRHLYKLNLGFKKQKVSNVCGLKNTNLTLKMELSSNYKKKFRLKIEMHVFLRTQEHKKRFFTYTIYLNFYLDFCTYLCLPCVELIP